MNYRNPLFLVILIVVVLATYAVLTMPDRRSATDKISDAVGDLPKGVDKAGRDLESRTPGQKLGDAVKDGGGKAGDIIKDDTAPQQ